MTKTPSPQCLHCGRNDSQVPLARIRYRGEDYWICTEHFPLLIHEPGKLTGQLPGAENLTPVDHD